MNKEFQTFHDSLPKLLKEFVKIQKTTNTAREAMREIAETLQKEANLYYAAVRIVEDEYFVLDSVYGKNKEDVEYSLRYWPAPIPIDSKNNEFIAQVMSGKLQIYSGQQKNVPFFNSTPFPFLVSWISLPIQKGGKVFCVIELGSDEFMIPPRYKHDARILSAFKLPFEVLLSKINEIADSKTDTNE